MSAPPPTTSPGPTPPPPPNQTISPPSPPDVALFSPPGPPGALAPVASPGGLARGAFIGLIAGIVIGAVSVLVAVAFFVIVRRRRMIRRKRRREHMGFGNESPKVTMPPTNPQLLVMDNPPELPLKNNNLDSQKPHHLPSPGISLGFSKSTFTYEELSMATDGFADTNLLGQGGFGYVHKGILPNGTEVAIKQLKAGSGQGEREFQAEVEIISRIHHKHLVSLVGYCISGIQRMLVYEFVANDTLEFHLHGKGRPTMSWEIRMRIALGSAKGLAYLHEDCQPKVIHRDIKASNILLDSNFEAKVADFGLAKSSVDADTHVSTRVMGTFGYLAPEYASSGKLTDKSDVFSFGVMLLELITGRQPFDRTQTFEDDSMIDWARPLLSKALDAGNFDSIADPILQKDYDLSEMGRMVACAAVCVRYSARRRPRMSQVVRALEGNISLDNLNGGILPGHSTGFSSFGSSDYDIGQYNEDMRKFRKMALETQEHSTGELSGSTNPSTLHPSGSNSEDQQTTEEPAVKK